MLLNEINWRTPELCKELLTGCKSLLVSKNLFLKIVNCNERELKILRHQRAAGMQNMTRKTVGIIFCTVIGGIGFFGFFKMKILENLPASVIVEILRKQSHEKINTGKKCGKNLSDFFS